MMSLRGRMTVYLIGLHLIFFALTVSLYRDRPVVFVTLELLLLISLFGGISLINNMLQPLDYTQRLHDLLQDKNYAARLQHTSNDGLGELVNLFNTMLDALYQERLKLGEQRGLLDRLLEATPSAVVVFDFDSRISLLNASASSLLGLATPEGMLLSDWLHGNGQFVADCDDRCRNRGLALLRQLDTLPLAESQLLTDPDGRRYRCQRSHFFDRGFARHFLIIEELTEELASSEKSTYEKLIRVLAHEVNNTVAATGSVLESLLFYQSQLEQSDRIDFRTAIEAVQRRNSSLGEFIDRFTHVVKMPEPERRPTAIAELMEDSLRLFREQCRSRGIRIEWRRCDTVAPHVMDHHLLAQTLLNIVKNAMEAVETSKREQQNDDGYILLELANEDGKTRLSIIDSGNRLSDVPPGQLFSPFFTTKKGGQGIGLLFVREVLNRHGFPYRLAATGQGETRFDIWIPAAS